MIQTSEIIVPALALGGHVLYLFPFIRTRIRQIAHSRLLLSSFYCLFIGWTLTAVESFCKESRLVFLAHLCYCVSAFLFMGWAWLLQRRKRPMP